MSEKELVIVSALVLVDQDGRVLICERPKGKFMEGFWEFPGGKLEKNETPENCLIREIKEEIGVNLGDFCFSPLTFSLNEYDDFNILLLLYICRENVGVIMSNENQNMKWLFVKDLYDCNLLPADRELIPYIRDSVLTLLIILFNMSADLIIRNALYILIICKFSSIYFLSRYLDLF